MLLKCILKAYIQSTCLDYKSGWMDNLGGLWSRFYDIHIHVTIRGKTDIDRDRERGVFTLGNKKHSSSKESIKVSKKSRESLVVHQWK